MDKPIDCYAAASREPVATLLTMGVMLAAMVLATTIITHLFVHVSHTALVILFRGAAS